VHLIAHRIILWKLIAAVGGGENAELFKLFIYLFIVVVRHQLLLYLSLPPDVRRRTWTDSASHMTAQQL
jgi:hypothetical protein